MRATRLTLLLAVGAFLGPLLFGAAPTYKLTDLGCPSGFTEAQGVAVNNAGQIAGNAYDNDGQEHAFICTNGTITILPLPNGYSRCRAVAMNSSGEIVGVIFRNDGVYFGFAYAGGAVQVLSTVDQQQNAANAINDAGVIVGNSDILRPNIGVHGWIYPSSDLGIAGGYAASDALAIDSAGQVLVIEEDGPPTNLFLYSNGILTSLGISGGEDARMSSNGFIVGQTNGYLDPFLYANGKLTDLTTTYGLSSGTALLAVNSSGTILGETFVFMNGTAYFFSTTVNLTGASGYNRDSISAFGLSDSGLITGEIYPSGSSIGHLMLLTPASSSGGGGGGGGGTTPTINTQPVSQSVNLGASASFTVGASGSGTLKYQWYLNGNIISGATKAVYAIAKTTAASAGNYTVTVTLGTSSVTSQAATLAVVVPLPVITTPPVAATLKSKANASFKVVVKNQTGVTFSYQWQREPAGTSTWSNVSNSGPYSGATTANLAVKAVTLVMSGDQFRCIVTNLGGSTTSGAARLLIQSAPAITLQPVNTSLFVTTSATFVIVASGVPTLTYQWQRLPAGGKKWAALASNATYNGTTTSTLAVNNVAFTMTGDQFNCVLKNSLGTVVSANATLTVTPWPANISSQPADANVLAGANAAFTVAAVGVPAPSLQWQISTDGGNTWSNLSANITFSGVASTTLMVTNVTGNLSGDEFRCYVSNSAGSTTSDPATLALLLPPAITVQPSNIGVLSNSVIPTGNFTLVATGNPPPSFQWQVSTDGTNWSNLSDNSNYSGSLTPNLTLLDASNDSSYQYRCVVANSLGSITSNTVEIVTIHGIIPPRHIN